MKCAGKMQRGEKSVFNVKIKILCNRVLRESGRSRPSMASATCAHPVRNPQRFSEQLPEFQPIKNPMPFGMGFVIGGGGGS